MMYRGLLNRLPLYGSFELRGPDAVEGGVCIICAFQYRAGWFISNSLDYSKYVWFKSRSWYPPLSLRCFIVFFYICLSNTEAATSDKLWNLFTRYQLLKERTPSIFTSYVYYSLVLVSTYRTVRNYNVNSSHNFRSSTIPWKSCKIHCFVLYSHFVRPCKLTNS